MRVGMSYDANKEARLDEVIRGANASLGVFFSDRFYDDSGMNLFVVLMCRDPKLNFQKRIRLSRSDNTLYIDVMLDVTLMSAIDVESGRAIVARKMLEDIPIAIQTKRSIDFDSSRFIADLGTWFENNGWLQSGS